MLRFAAFLGTLATAFAQSPIPKSNTPTGAPAGSVIRIDVNLVQVDAVVTDSEGKRVSNLKPSDFTLWQDSKVQEITNFTYVSAPAITATTARSSLPAKPARGEAPPPPPVLQPEEVRRTLGLVVDDLGLAGESIPKVRSAIKNFVDEDMRPGDLIAIVRTGAGMGSLQQFTTDKRLLYAALDRVKYGQSRMGVSSFVPLGSLPGSALNHQREDTLTAGSLGALRYVVNAMRGLPGRKSVILFTENIRMVYRRAAVETVAAAVQQLSDAASRASVVVHAIDPRGMPDYQIEASDYTVGMSGPRMSRVPAQREQEVFNTEPGMFVLAEKTGGRAIHDRNDLAAALRETADDSDGYYLLGYHPDISTFENKDGQPKFHHLEVRLRRAGLHVRSREGFFGEPGLEQQPREHTREAELTHAMESPFSAGSIHPRLTAYFTNSRQMGSVIDAMLTVNPGELEWSTEPDGNREAHVDVAVEAFDEDGNVLSPVNATFELQMKNQQQYDEAMRSGFVYSMELPATKPGAYLLRAALRDPASKGTGVVEQFVEVPNVEPGHLALSGIVLQLAGTPVSPQSAQGSALRADNTGGAAGRIFHHGTPVDYGFEILNAQVARNGDPDLDIQIRVFREGTQVLSGKTSMATSGGALDAQRFVAGGRIMLGNGMNPGVYVLQVVVSDKLSTRKPAIVTQSVDFNIE